MSSTDIGSIVTGVVRQKGRQGHGYRNEFWIHDSPMEYVCNTE